MKKLTLTLFLLLNICCFSQVITEIEMTKNTPSVEAVSSVDAHFDGGRDAFYKFLSENLIYPKSAIENKITGKVYIQFTVNKKGKLRDFKILKGIEKSPDCNNEAMRVLKKMPNWIPASLNNKNVSSVFTLPISFQLQ